MARPPYVEARPGLLSVVRRAATALAVVVAVSGAIEASRFAKHVERARTLAPCAEHAVKGGFYFQLLTDVPVVLGFIRIGFESGTLHGYGGPGTAYFEFALASFSAQVVYPLCAPGS